MRRCPEPGCKGRLKHKDSRITHRTVRLGDREHAYTEKILVCSVNGSHRRLFWTFDMGATDRKTAGDRVPHGAVTRSRR